MKVEQVKALPPKGRFLYWVKERQQILLKRRAGKPKPWTNDEVLSSYYFTNVQRENDKVTTWFRDNIRDPLKSSQDVVFATIAFRWFNWPETGEQLLKQPTDTSHGAFTDWKLDMVKSKLHGLKEHGAKVFTGAFTISNGGSTKSKIDRVCDDYIQPAWNIRGELYQDLVSRPRMSASFDRIKVFPGFGGSGFMAAQVICDLAYTHVLQDAPDWWTWCSWGPGSKKGMNKVFGFDESHSMSKPEWHKNLEYLRQLISKKLGMNLHARDVQSCCCEFSKYERGLQGTGRLKRRYP